MRFGNKMFWKLKYLINYVSAFFAYILEYFEKSFGILV